MFGRTDVILSCPLPNARLKDYALLVNCDTRDNIVIDAYVHAEVSLCKSCLLRLLAGNSRELVQRFLSQVHSSHHWKLHRKGSSHSISSQPQSLELSGYKRKIPSGQKCVPSCCHTKIFGGEMGACVLSFYRIRQTEAHYTCPRRVCPLSGAGKR